MSRTSACKALAKAVRAFIDSEDDDRIEELDAMLKALRRVEKSKKLPDSRKDLQGVVKACLKGGVGIEDIFIEVGKLTGRTAWVSPELAIGLLKLAKPLAEVKKRLTNKV